MTPPISDSDRATLAANAVIRKAREPWRVAEQVYIEQAASEHIQSEQWKRSLAAAGMHDTFPYCVGVCREGTALCATPKRCTEEPKQRRSRHTRSILGAVLSAAIVVGVVLWIAVKAA